MTDVLITGEVERHGSRAALHRVPGLPPPAIIYNIGERCAPHWPKLSERVSNRQDGVRMVAVGYTHRPFRLLFVDQVKGRQRGSKAERPRCE